MHSCVSQDVLLACKRGTSLGRRGTLVWWAGVVCPQQASGVQVVLHVSGKLRRR